MKMHPMGAELFHADGQKDMTKLKVDAAENEDQHQDCREKFRGDSKGYLLNRSYVVMPRNYPNTNLRI